VGTPHRTSAPVATTPIMVASRATAPPNPVAIIKISSSSLRHLRIFKKPSDRRLNPLLGVLAHILLVAWPDFRPRSMTRPDLIAGGPKSQNPQSLSPLPQAVTGTIHAIWRAELLKKPRKDRSSNAIALQGPRTFRSNDLLLRQILRCRFNNGPPKSVGAASGGRRARGAPYLHHPPIGRLPCPMCPSQWSGNRARAPYDKSAVWCCLLRTGPKYARLDVPPNSRMILWSRR